MSFHRTMHWTTFYTYLFVTHVRDFSQYVTLELGHKYSRYQMCYILWKFSFPTCSKLLALLNLVFPNHREMHLVLQITIEFYNLLISLVLPKFSVLWIDSSYSLSIMVGWILAPEDVHTPIPRSCEYVTFHTKRSCADVIVKDFQRKRSS